MNIILLNQLGFTSSRFSNIIINKKLINMNVTFKLIKINVYLTLLRPICIVLSGLPIFFVKNQHSILLSIWIATFFCMYIVFSILFVFLIKRFKVIGSVNLFEDKIEITKDNGELFTFNPIDKKILIRINGFRGESTQFFYIAISEGIGSIEIEDNNNWFKFTILADNVFRKELLGLINKYKQKGCLVTLGKY